MGAKDYTIFLVIGIGAIMYLYALWKAHMHSKKGTPEEMPNGLSTVLTIIGGLLATNLGAFLGIKIEQNAFNSSPLLDIPTKTQTVIQLAFALLYLASLIYAFFSYYALSKPLQDKAVPVFRQLPMTLVGVVAGVFAILLTK